MIDLNRCKLMVGTPCHNSLAPQYTYSMIRLTGEMASVKASMTVTFVIGSLLDKARCQISEKFLASDCTHLLFCDADQGFEPQDPIRMMTHDLSIIGGVVPMKTLGWERVLSHVRTPEFCAKSDQDALHELSLCGLEPAVEWLPDHDNSGDVVEVSRIGTGFMLVKRDVFEEIALARPDLKMQTGSIDETGPEPFLYRFFSTEVQPETRRFKGEDWAFCDLWKSLGPDHKIYVDAQCHVTHIGNYEFSF